MHFGSGSGHRRSEHHRSRTTREANRWTCLVSPVSFCRLSGCCLVAARSEAIGVCEGDSPEPLGLHPHLTTQKSFYVEISRARDRAELVTDDAAELRAQLQAATGERIAALEGIGEMKREAPDKAGEAARDRSVRPERGPGEGAGKAREGMKTPAKTPEPPVRDRGKGGMDLGL